MCCPTFVSTSCCSVSSSSGSMVLPVFSLNVSQCLDFSAGLARAWSSNKASRTAQNKRGWNGLLQRPGNNATRPIWRKQSTYGNSSADLSTIRPADASLDWQPEINGCIIQPVCVSTEACIRTNLAASRLTLSDRANTRAVVYVHKTKAEKENHV